MTNVILIAGPTASGKSAAALTLAERLNGTVINADSMQVYRELRVLTARPSSEEGAAVPHRLYGTVPGAEAYSVGRWLDDVGAAIAETCQEGRVPILVGGTGLYFKALLEGLSPVPEIPPETRAHWRAEADRLDADGLHGLLAARDPMMASRLNVADPQRIVRALEVIDATGVSLAEWQEHPGTPILTTRDVRKLVIAPERDAIYGKIDKRFDRMLMDGAIEEVQALTELRLDRGMPVMRACGVPELGAYLAGLIGLDEAAAKAKTTTRRYAKRQMTWLKRFMADWDWVPEAQAVNAHERLHP